jgi:opacity protein-like surface antigen
MMQNLGKLTVFVALSMLMIGVSARAEYRDSAGYVQLAGSAAQCSWSGQEVSGDCGDSFDGSLGFNFRGGIRASEWLTIEGQVEWMSGYDRKSVADISPPVPGLTRASLESVAYTVNARLYPLDGRIQPYAIAGIGGQNTWLSTNLGDSDTFTSFIGRFGGGVDIYLTRNLAITGEFTYVAATEASRTNYGPYWGQYWTTNSGIDPSYMSVSWGVLYAF